MRIRAKPKGNEICLDATERRTMRKAAEILVMLARYLDDAAAKESCDEAAKIATRWGTEPEAKK